jgi:hypothetical protein
MKSFLLLLCLITQVYAVSIPGSYERMFLYYAVLFDREVNGGRSTKLIPNCPDGSSFNKFIAWMEQTETVPFITNDETPDVDKTAKDLQDKGHTGEYFVFRIQPGLDKDDLVRLFRQITDIVEGCIERLPDENQMIFDRLTMSMQRVHFFRIHARAEIMEKKLIAKYPDLKVKLVKKTHTLEPPRTDNQPAIYEIFDQDGTEENNPDRKSDIHFICQEVINHKKHKANIEAAEASARRLRALS